MSLPSLSQQISVVNGAVYDAATKQPIDLAGVQIEKSGLGVITDGSGNFSLAIPDRLQGNRLVFTFLGYKPVYLDSSTYIHQANLKVFLHEDAFMFKDVEIKELSAKEILKRCADSFPKWYYSDSVIQQCFYRQYHKENGRYVRLIDADVSVYSLLNANVPLGVLKEKIRVNDIRRSLVYEHNGAMHDDHLVDLLKDNPMAYYKTSFLNPANVALYKPRFIADSAGQYVIFLHYRESASDKIENITLWINKSDYAITKMENCKFPNPMFVDKTKYRGEWIFQNEVEILETKKEGYKYVLSSFTRAYNHQVVNKQTRILQYVVEEVFELTALANQTQNISAELAKGGFSGFSSLYTLHYNYKPEHWTQLGIEAKFTLDDYVRKDLEQTLSLQKQFETAGD